MKDAISIFQFQTILDGIMAELSLSHAVSVTEIENPPAGPRATITVDGAQFFVRNVYDFSKIKVSATMSVYPAYWNEPVPQFESAVTTKPKRMAQNILKILADAQEFTRKLNDMLATQRAHAESKAKSVSEFAEVGLKPYGQDDKRLYGYFGSFALDINVNSDGSVWKTEIHHSMSRAQALKLAEFLKTL